MTPRIVRDGDSHRIVLPGEPGYADGEAVEKER